MTAFVVFLIAVGIGVLAGVIAYEVRDGRAEWAEYEAWLRAREATGSARYPSGGAR